MFYYIKGKTVLKENGFVVLDNNGIGYRIFVSTNTMAKCETDKEVTLYTYLQIKEDAHLIYGFFEKNELEMFQHLTSISGIGCKLAVTLLSGITPFDLAMAIATADTKALKRIKGVGSKTAERIVLELKEKISAQDITTSGAEQTSEIADAILALQALGWTRPEAAKVIAGIENAANMPLNTLVTFALKSLAK